MTALPLIRKHPIVTLAVTLIAAVLIGWWLNPWHADAAGETESVLTPITPCRAVDTREAIGIDRTTKLGEGESVDVAFAGGVGDCVLPNNITAVSANIFAVAPTATSPVSFFTVGPADEELSTTSVLNFNNQLPVYGNEIRIPLSTNGAATIFNAFGNVHLVADINGYYTPTTSGDGGAELAALQDRVAELETLLADVTRQPDNNGYDTITFTGVNLQLVDGTGATYANNSGLGNLIIGYNNPTFAGPRDGAHNVVVGDGHTYGNNGAGEHAAGGIVAGSENSITRNGASVTGGVGNDATGLFSSVSGGIGNSATGMFSSVGGGFSNEANGESATVTGGSGNLANGEAASVSGGSANSAVGSRASITGGFLNVNDGAWSTIVGGRENVVNSGAPFAVVVGGQAVTAAEDFSVAVGGNGNIAGGEYSVAIGGVTNNAQADRSVTLGGLGGITTNDFAVSLYAPNNGLKNCDSTACAPSGTIEAYVALP